MSLRLREMPWKRLGEHYNNSQAQKWALLKMRTNSASSVVKHETSLPVPDQIPSKNAAPHPNPAAGELDGFEKMIVWEEEEPGPWLWKDDLMTSPLVQKEALLWSALARRGGGRRWAEGRDGEREKEREREEAAWSEFSLPSSHLYSSRAPLSALPFHRSPFSAIHTHACTD